MANITKEQYEFALARIEELADKIFTNPVTLPGFNLFNGKNLDCCHNLKNIHYHSSLEPSCNG